MVYATETDSIAHEFEITIHPSFIKSTITVYKRQLLRLISNKTQLVFVILMPLMWLGIIGTSMTNLVPASMLNGQNFLTFMAPGIFIMVTLFSGIFGGISLFYDRDSGYLKNYLIAPSPRIAIVVGYALGTSTRVIIQVTLLMAFSVFLNANLNLTLFNIIIIYVFAILTTNFLMGLSITLASKAPNVEVFQSIIMPIVMPLQFLAPILYPASDIPAALRWIALINPITFGVDGIRGAIQSVQLTTPILTGKVFGIDFTFLRTNIVIFDMLFLFIAGTVFLFIGARLFLKSLAG